jgi:hypothetical protein
MFPRRPGLQSAKLPVSSYSMPQLGESTNSQPGRSMPATKNMQSKWLRDENCIIMLSFIERLAASVYYDNDYFYYTVPIILLSRPSVRL